jgi:adenine/guanine phosphoribosyltransferase-like PRPP-binding protein
MKKNNDGSGLIVREKQDDASGCLILRNNYLKTLKRCKGFYECPCDSNGNFTGPLVGYAGTYEDIDGNIFHFVGAKYYNFSQADQWPEVLTIFAEAIASILYDCDIWPTVILGAPMAGLKLSQEVAQLIGCRHIFAEKKFVRMTDDGQRPIEELVLARYEINPGDQVIIGEELVNNCSTTAKLIELVNDAGGEVIGIVCAINRSYPFIDKYREIPIIGVIEQPTRQYRQDEPEVAPLVQAGNIIWKPKTDDWPRLQKVMEEQGTF